MTREEAQQHDQELHQRYFQPFERLLERKAAYYEAQAEQGKENKYLLAEIETMDAILDYVATLETIAQQRLDEQLAFTAEIEKHRRTAEYWRRRWQEAAKWRALWKDLAETPQQHA